MAKRQEREPGISQRYRHGLELWQRGCFDQAIEELAPLQSRTDLTGRMARYYAALAHRSLAFEALHQGRYEQAEMRLRRAVSLAGPSADLADFLCAVLARAGRSAECLETAEQALPEDAHNPQRWVRVAQAQWQAGQHVQAHMTLGQALRRLGDHAMLHRQLGLFHAAEEHYDLAGLALEKAVALDHSDANAHYYLGMTLAAQGRGGEALAWLQRCCELQPQDLLAACQLAAVARLLSHAGQQLVLKLMDAHPRGENLSQARHLARYVTQEGAFVDAFLALPPSPVDDELFGLLETVLRMALAEHQDYADLHCRLSRVIGRLGRTDEAMMHARRAVQINANYRLARLHLGALLMQAGQTTEAIEHLKKVLDLGGDWPDVHTLIAQAHVKAGQAEAARQHLGRALELNHRYQPAAEALARLAA
jgi:tetratricopeptide (TPR) repeat protein